MTQSPVPMQGAQVEFPAGTVIFKEGDPGGDLFFVREGEIEVYKVSSGIDVHLALLKTGEILAQKRVPISPNEIQLITRSEFAPEVGQSLATAYQQLMDRMAREIVDLMEAPTL